MNLDYAAAMDAAFEKDHWWIRSRFRLIDLAINHLESPAPWSVLELGCGTGINLDYLVAHHPKRIAHLCGVDPEAAPRHESRLVIRKDVPMNARYDLILAMDVLEHLSDPLSMLNALGPLLKASGRLLVTVPAFQWLWTRFDDLAHHHRRYTLGELCGLLEAAGYQIDTRFYAFGTLFPLFAAQRLALKLMPWRDERVFRQEPQWLNRILFSINSWEINHWMRRNVWAGSSAVAIAHRGPAT